MPINITATDQGGADFLRQAKVFFKGLVQFLAQEENESEHQGQGQNENDLQTDKLPPNTASPALIPTAAHAGIPTPLPSLIPDGEVRGTTQEIAPVLPPKESDILNNQESLPNSVETAAPVATAGMNSGAGVMFMSPNGSVLFLRRSEQGDEAGKWAFPGGRTEPGETPEVTARREAKEEVGNDCGGDCGRMVQADQRQVGATNFTTYLAPAPREFQPQLNGEHNSYAWRPLNNPPQPLHPGVKQTLDELKRPASASKPLAMDPLTGKGQKILSSMQDQYGSEKGKQVFYASKNKGKISGVDADQPPAYTYPQQAQIPVQQTQSPVYPAQPQAPAPDASWASPPWKARDQRASRGAKKSWASPSWQRTGTDEISLKIKRSH